MIVYSETKKVFINDVFNGELPEIIEEKFKELGVFGGGEAEVKSWRNSLRCVSEVIQDPRIDDDVQVAVEFQIPLTSKRIDFMIGGKTDEKDHVVVIELKQWEKCFVTDKEDVVNAFTGGANRDVVHPSHQAYSYAKLIENFNEAVEEQHIEMNPCAYLHNYESKYEDQIRDSRYQKLIDQAPVFLAKDNAKLRDFIAKYVSKRSEKNLFEIIDYGKLKPSKSLQSVAGSMLNGNKEFEMVDEQLVAYSTVLKILKDSLSSEQKHTIIIQGGPGTGKSVIAINLLAKMLNNKYSCAYTTKTSTPRTAFCSKLIKGKYNIKYLEGLFKSSGSFSNAKNNQFDCLLCDEAHRLNEKSGLYGNKGENQIKEIIHASKVSVFFIDENQKVHEKDIGTVEEIKRWAQEQGSVVHANESLVLTSQFRCNGSDSYLAFLDDVLGVRKTANNNYFDIDYDIRIFDDSNEMKRELEKKNTNNKARMIAGYCYHWNSKKDKSSYDIFLKNGFKAQWNFTTDKFAIDENSFEQVGCIHSTQGLEFDYVGIIIGKDLRYENGKVITDVTMRDKRDSTVRSCRKNDPKLCDEIIRNTYRTLLSRGQKGCFVYCEDEALGNYLKERLNKVERIDIKKIDHTKKSTK